jgi:sugar-specific transcriptional regulator TrmB
MNRKKMVILWFILSIAGIFLTGCASPKQVIPPLEKPAVQPEVSADTRDAARAEEIKRLEALIQQLEKAEKKLLETQRQTEEALRRIEQAAGITEMSVERIEQAQEKIEAVGTKTGHEFEKKK